jgi:hypothetical protein
MENISSIYIIGILSIFTGCIVGFLLGYSAGWMQRDLEIFEGNAEMENDEVVQYYMDAARSMPRHIDDREACLREGLCSSLVTRHSTEEVA